MLVGQRRNRIIELLKENHSISVSDLCEILEASEATIRRDLSILESSGKLERTHGGAIYNESNRINIEDVLSSREGKFLLEKQHIAKKAFDLLENHDTIVLDAGTTTYELAYLIGQSNLHLTIVTNSMIVFKELAKNPNVELIILGGKVRTNTLASVGSAAVELMQRLFVDKAFLGTNGISLMEGFTTTDMDEAGIKRAMIQSSKQRIILADNSKFNKVYINQFAPISMVDVIVTDNQTSKELLNEFIERYDIKVI
ncbi:MAG TPA: DeoR/GlpR family DNA-binding transcription regulator [Erysipelotrichaceae bacterium]|nr:DeoR/GlpR family DNA-binding transcription regulator [Erysipelotrichaceae bacterium]